MSRWIGMDSRSPLQLRTIAARYRCIAAVQLDRRACEALLELAEKYEGLAVQIESREVATGVS